MEGGEVDGWRGGWVGGDWLLEHLGEQRGRCVKSAGLAPESGFCAEYIKNASHKRKKKRKKGMPAFFISSPVFK